MRYSSVDPRPMIPQCILDGLGQVIGTGKAQSQPHNLAISEIKANPEV